MILHSWDFLRVWDFNYRPWNEDKRPGKIRLGPIKYIVYGGALWMGFPSGIYLHASAAVHFMAQIWTVLTPLAVFLEVHGVIASLNRC